MLQEGLEVAVRAAVRSLPREGGDVVITVQGDEALVHAPQSQFIARVEGLRRTASKPISLRA